MYSGYDASLIPVMMLFVSVVAVLVWNVPSEVFPYM